MSKINSQSSIVNNQSQKGFIALTSTIIISAVILLLIVGIFTISIIEIEKSEARYNSEMARSWANYCVEEALQEIRDDSDYTTEESEAFGGSEDGCFFDVDDNGNGGKIVQSTGEYSNHTRKIKVVVSEYDPLLVIDSWEEVTDF